MQALLLPPSVFVKNGQKQNKKKMSKLKIHPCNKQLTL